MAIRRPTNPATTRTTRLWASRFCARNTCLIHIPGDAVPFLQWEEV